MYLNLVILISIKQMKKMHFIDYSSGMIDFRVAKTLAHLGQMVETLQMRL